MAIGLCDGCLFWPRVCGAADESLAGDWKTFVKPVCHCMSCNFGNKDLAVAGTWELSMEYGAFIRLGLGLHFVEKFSRSSVYMGHNV